MTIDGEPPSTSEAKAYLKRKADEAEGGRNSRRDPAELVTPGTLQLVNETDERGPSVLYRMAGMPL